MINYLAAFGIGAGLGYCTFFRPKQEQLYTPFIKEKLQMMVEHNGLEFSDPIWNGTSMANVRSLYLPPIRFEEMKWREDWNLRGLNERGSTTQSPRHNKEASQE